MPSLTGFCISSGKGPIDRTPSSRWWPLPRRRRRCAQATFDCLGEILSRRLRNTDLTGWLDQHRVAATLPGTPTAGAWRLAEDVCREFPEHVPAPVCTILTYPTDGAQKELRRDSARPARPMHWSVQPMETLFMVKTPLWKRTLDIFGAAVGLIVLSPLFVVVAALVKFTSPGPVFYTQLRSGEGGKPFKILKFRSMCVDADNRKASLMAVNEQDGPAFKAQERSASDDHWAIYP